MEHEFRLKAIQGFGWNHANKLAEYGILYVFSLVLARFLGAEEYGVYSVVISVISLLLVISSIGFDQALNKFVAQLSEPRQIEQLRFLVRRLGLIRLGSHVLLSGGLLVFRYQISVLFKNDGIAQYLEIMSLYILFKGMGDFLANVFIGKLETKIVFIVNTVNRVLLLAVGTFLLTGGFGLFEVLVVFAGVSGLTFLIFLIKSKSQIFGREAYLPLSSVFSFAAANWLFLIVGIGLGRYSDMVLLGGIKGAGNETGFYDLAYSLTMAIEFVFAMGFMGVVLSVFSKLAHSDPA
ncbi:MAG: oligosaccharide flippase family protein, partial [Ignavibacteria bacterium]|nr:oligosaccharide flippase family protein [Ignavibacteria bacterium]